MFGNFVERNSFHIVSGDSLEAMRKLFLSTKFPHQEIKWNYVFFCSAIELSEERIFISENHADINQLRCTTYCQKRVKVETLPPYQNFLRQHMKIYVWQKLENFVSQDSPVNHGLFINNDQLDILWMTCKPAPHEVSIPLLMLLV